MAEQRIGIVMNGVTGRMGTNQHVVRSIAAIRARRADGDDQGALSCACLIDAAPVPGYAEVP